MKYLNIYLINSDRKVYMKKKLESML